MNFAYGLFSSVFDIVIAAVFFLIAKRMGPIAPKIRIKSEEIGPLQAATSNPQSDSSDDKAMQFLITNGIAVANRSDLAGIATEYGLVCQANLPDLHEAMGNAKIKVSKDCAARVHRQLLSCSPNSGLILLHLVQGAISIVE